MNNLYSAEVNSRHSISRAKERAGLNIKKAQKLMDLARERGIGCEECRWSLDRQFLANRTNDTAKAVAYNGYCFIFDKVTNNCITMYGLPQYFGKKKKTLYTGRALRSYAFEYEL